MLPENYKMLSFKKDAEYVYLYIHILKGGVLKVSFSFSKENQVLESIQASTYRYIHNNSRTGPNIVQLVVVKTRNGAFQSLLGELCSVH